MLETALKYCNEYGWCIIPLRGKKPRIKWAKYQRRRSTEAEIRRWWNKWPDANVGIVTGGVSGLVVIDVDKKEALPKLELPTTLTARTGGGGWHFYFKRPPNVKKLKNAVNLHDGVDVRADGGYVVAPPSKHASGKKYSWKTSGVRPKTLTDELLGQIRESNDKGPVEWDRKLEEGERDVELTRRVGKLIGSGIPPEEVLTLAHELNQTHCKPPLPDEQVEKIVDSIKRRELQSGGNGHTKDTDGFRVVDFGTALRDYGLHEVEWHIEGWLPCNTIAMLVAPPGTYKTWLLLDLATATATDRDFLGQYPTSSKGPVLMLQQEDPFPLLFSRLAQIMNFGPLERTEDGHHRLYCPGGKPDIFWHPDRQLNFNRPETLDGLEAAIKKLKPKMVMLDPLYSASDTSDYMAESATQMLRLKNLRDQYDCSFVVAHHTSKNADGTGRQELWGSQFLNAWLETGWQIRPGKCENEVRLLRHFKMAPEQKELRLTFEIDDYNYEVEVEETSGGNEDADVEKMIIQLIEDGEELTSYRQIADATGRSKSAVGRVLRESNQIVKIGGQYQLKQGEPIK